MVISDEGAVLQGGGIGIGRERRGIRDLRVFNVGERCQNLWRARLRSNNIVNRIPRIGAQSKCRRRPHAREQIKRAYYGASPGTAFANRFCPLKMHAGMHLDRGFTMKLDRYAVAIEFMILIVASLTCTEIRIVMHKLDRGNPLNPFES